MRMVSLRRTPLPDMAEARDFDAIYRSWFVHVWRWLRALGVHDADLEDIAHDVFLVVRRKLRRFDGANVAGWLYQITSRTASDHRRRAWLRRVFLSGDKSLESFRDTAHGPAELLEQLEARAIVHGLLAKLSHKRRTALALFELEGYTGEEIAALLGVPVATVWTRLHHARREFTALARERFAQERT